MKKIAPLLLFFVAVASSLISCTAAIAQDSRFSPGRNRISLTHDEQIRTALVFLPTRAATPDSGWPLVIMLHGGGGSTRNVVDGTGWATVGEREGFISVFPNGTPVDEDRPESFLLNPQTWNCGPGVSLAAGEGSATAKEVDDVGFLSELIRFVGQNATIDRRRIYICGHSNGAAMAYRFAHERSDLVAAVGVMAGHFMPHDRRAIGPVSLLQIVGDRDPFTPMNGGLAGIGRKKTPMPPALDGPRAWAAALGLDTSRCVIVDSGGIEVRSWGPNTCGSEVVSMVVRGHGHGYLWPGDRSLPGFLIGPTVPTLNATEKFWEFFMKHPKVDCHSGGG